MRWPRRCKLERGADILGIRPATLANPTWRKKHGIPAFKVGKALIFDVTELETWLSARREGGRRPAA